MSTSIRNRRAVPVIVGARRNGRQRYASTSVPTMRKVAERATVALVGIVLAIGGLSIAASGATISSECADIEAGTDVLVPTDVAAICALDD